jgi:hypothetical protein
MERIKSIDSLYLLCYRLISPEIKASAWIENMLLYVKSQKRERKALFFVAQNPNRLRAYFYSKLISN